MPESGRVASVSSRLVASTLTAAASSGATTLQVADNVDLDAGTAVAVIGGTATTYAVIAAVSGDTTVVISPGLAADADLGTKIRVEPERYENTAMVRLTEGGEAVPCTVPSGLLRALPAGVRDEATSETVTVERDGDGYRVVALVAESDLRDTGWIDLEHSGSAGTLRYRVIADVVYVEGNVAIPMTSGVAVVVLDSASALPDRVRPSLGIWVPGRVTTGSQAAQVGRNENGTITAIQVTGSAAPGIQFAYDYPIG